MSCSKVEGGGDEVVEGDYGSFTWEAAPVLSAYLEASPQQMWGSVVVELGCGTALPGFTAARLGAATVLLTDRSESTRVLQTCRRRAVELGVSNVVQVEPLDWGFTLDSVPIEAEQQFVVIASDCFYDLRDYDDIFATVTDLLSRYGGCFMTAYRLRTARSFQHHATKWGLSIQELPLPETVVDDATGNIRLLRFTLNQTT